tara:strand:+ start:10412 stop:12343 length:1932 start_codon:yes stop_codon:yes gene_type:complete
MSLSKMIMGQSGNQGSGASLDVDDVYSTFLYEGTNNPKTITNGIDLSNEGGLVWSKSRSHSNGHALVDTERGVTKYLISESTDAETTDALTLTSFNSDGYTLGSDSNSDRFNRDNREYVSWTFRKAPKFFDVVTYTGDGSSYQTISHNLGTTVGFIIIKNRSRSGDNWTCFHRSLDANKTLYLNTTAAVSNTAAIINVSSTSFDVENGTLTNQNGDSYVAYIFAHNDGDGEFGPSGDQDIIKCGSYTGNGSTDGPEINVGFEPQFVMIKRATGGSAGWFVLDNMRGITANDNDAYLEWNTSSQEFDTSEWFDLRPTGWKNRRDWTLTNHSGSEYIYMVIRRGSLAAPTSSSQVFEVDNAGSTGDGVDPKFRSGFPVDFALRKDTGSGNWEALTRLLQGTSLRPNDTDAEDSGSGGDQFDYMNGYNTGTNTDSSLYSWMWKRAPKYFDVVTYTGASGAQTITHNLGVVPEMIWLKKRSEVSATNGGWVVYHGTTSNLILNENFSSGFAVNNSVNHSTISATTFEVANGNADVNDVGEDHVAYLFASVAGVSKIGSVAHSGSSTDVDCGFSNGSKFVLLKRTDDTSNWRLFDSDRGIVSGNDPHTFVNLSSAQNTSTDLIDPLSSGFQITDDLDDGTYLFYAIAA